METTDPNESTYQRVHALILQGFQAQQQGETLNRHLAAYYQKIAPLLSPALREALAQAPQDAATAEKLRLELTLQFQRQVFVLHAAMFLDAFDRDL